MKEKYLPLGTVVLLKKATKPLMIIGYCGVDLKKRKVYDYSGIVYPEGFLGSIFNLMFNHEQIDKIITEGYVDEKWTTFMKTLKESTKNKTNEELFKEFTDSLESSAEKANNEIKENKEKTESKENASNDTDNGDFGEGI